MPISAKSSSNLSTQSPLNVLFQLFHTMLLRRGKAFAIAAGHYAESDCLDRVVGYLRAAVAAKALGNTRVGLIGGRFAGMGDFTVPGEELKARF